MATNSPGVKSRPVLRLHPLFFAVLVLSAFTGQLLLFVSACLAAVMHECGHAFAARRYGFSLDRIVLMPYGAVISGDISGISKKEEIAVCLAGPLTNGAAALFFVALWWMFPETYPYTDTAAYISCSLFLVNLLPAYPLDGGRILRVLLLPLGERRAGIVCRVLSALIAAGVLGYFVWSCFSVPAFSALFFALFLAAGSFGGGSYARLRFSRKRCFDRGVEEVRIALSADRPLQAALRFLREDRHVIFVIYDGEEYCGECSEGELLSALEREEPTVPLRKVVEGSAQFA